MSVVSVGGSLTENARESRRISARRSSTRAKRNDILLLSQTNTFFFLALTANGLGAGIAKSGEASR